jgi:hypothetical protein
MTAALLSQRHDAERELAEAEMALAAHRCAVALLRPYMEGTDRTLEDALAAMRADGIDPGWPLRLDEASA